MAHKQQEEASTVAGYKDKLVGGVKATVGGLLGIEQMEKAGKKQQEKGEAELRAAMEQQRAMGDRERRQKGKGRGEEEHMDPYMWVKREAFISEIKRGGAYDRRRMTMKHVDTIREPDVRKLFNQQGEKSMQFHLKRMDMRPLLDDIRQRRTIRPLNHVETKEKGLMTSIRLGKDDFRLKRSKDTLQRLWDDIRRPDNMNRLKKVSRSQIRDRSAPRLDLLRGLKSLHQQHDVLLREITAPPHLKHVETKDRTKPNLLFDSSTHVHRFEKDKLLKEVRKGLDQKKHVETNDRSNPRIEKDVHIKKIDRKGFLEEVRKGTELKHI